MKFATSLTIGVGFLGLSACQMTEPVVEKATTNLIAISYEAYGSTPTLSPDAIDKAIEHCKAQGGLYANYKGVSVPNPMFSAKEVHTFVCEKTKTDDNAVIAAQNEQYGAAAAANAAMWSSAADSFNEGYEAASPTRTQCTSIGFQTNCTSY